MNIDWQALWVGLGPLVGVSIGYLGTRSLEERRRRHEDKVRFHDRGVDASIAFVLKVTEMAHKRSTEQPVSPEDLLELQRSKFAIEFLCPEAVNRAATGLENTILFMLAQAGTLDAAEKRTFSDTMIKHMKTLRDAVRDSLTSSEGR